MIAIVRKFQNSQNSLQIIEDRLNDYFLICELTGKLEIMFLDKILKR